VYNSAHGKNRRSNYERGMIEEYESEKIIIGGNFNIRIGELRGEEENWSIVRRSKDKTIENKGRRLVKIIQGEGLNVMNGKTRDGEYTYVEVRGNAITDCVFVNESVQESHRI